MNEIKDLKYTYGKELSTVVLLLKHDCNFDILPLLLCNVNDLCRALKI